MSKKLSALYTAKHTGLSEAIARRIARHIDRGVQQSTDHPLVFFRADDIGIISHQFKQLIACFQKHRMPLCLATVPAWLNEPRLQELRRVTGSGSSQWCWHQHGRLHRNFAPAGKKQEYAGSRSKNDIYTSLGKGKNKLEQLLGLDFQPFFTPPWNRCSSDTLEALVALGFKAVSRSKGARPKTLPHLPDFQVNVDLHTRKEVEPAQSLENLMMEIEQGIASGLCGIMIHHQRMNGAALELLDTLLRLIKNHQQLVPVHFAELLNNDNG